MGEQNIGTNVLREYKPFAAFPRPELVAEEQVEGTLGLIEIVEELGQFNGEFVTLSNEFGVGFESCQPLGKCVTGALQELVVFVQDAGVGWRSGAGFTEGLKGANGVLEHIEVADAEI